MKIKILHMVEGAKKARGVTVIIDVFRAFTVEAYLMNNGADKIIPTDDIEKALEYKRHDPNIVLIGERHGVKLPGFDFGNSPSQIENISFKGKTIVHTTSAGTKGIMNAKNSEEILTGSLVNAKAISEYIKLKNPKEVSLVCMGLDALKETEEDNLCACYIKSLLESKNVNIEKEISDLKNTSGAKFFDERLQEIFPTLDFYLSTELNKFDFVLKYDNGCIKKIKM